ncbi:MAG: hypothetical protein H7Y00_02765, partial [Fimbriimonadaceae bacterium]|nr:hypothetical protein [Chitinophagales bacterium]
EMRNHGKGQKIYDAVIAFAKEKNIKTIYLLTETAEKFFTKNGFSKMGRNTAPEKILNTEEFKTLCASSAVAMMKHI